MIERYVAIIWNETLRTGVEEIDEQHRILVNMFNEANSRLTDSSGREVFEEILNDLLSYALYHFDTEEELMVQNQYSHRECEKHIQEHRGFSERVSQLRQDLQQSKLISRDDLLGFLYNWLVNHILTTDKRLGAFLRSTDGGAI